MTAIRQVTKNIPRQILAPSNCAFDIIKLERNKMDLQKHKERHSKLHDCLDELTAS